jgi:hypothetical protein
LENPGSRNPSPVSVSNHNVLGRPWGAVAALPLLRFPGPPAEPAVRLSTQRALHEGDAVQPVVIGS